MARGMGNWSLPGRSVLELINEGLACFESGDDMHEISLAQAREELTWSKLNELDRDEFRKAAKDQWQVWLDNKAVEVLSPRKVPS